MTPRPNDAIFTSTDNYQPIPSPKLKTTSSRGAKVVEVIVQRDEDKDVLWSRERKGTTGRQMAASPDEHMG